jgi:NADH pyrophosphatase NudC (nudix superfamily)
MRLIDADELKDHQFHGCYTNIHIASKTDAYMLGWNDAISAVVECAPTVDAESLITQHEDIGYERGYRDGYAEALEVTDDAEPVKHGHWIWDSDRFWHCSVCNEYSSWTYKYCPHCGAKMDEEEDEQL